MTTLFGRTLSLTVDKLDISDLDCQFHVKKSIKPEPNTCDLRIYNLNPSHRRALEKAKKLPVRLEAGYGTEVHQLYLGEVRGAHTVVEGPDIVTILTSGDKEAEIQKARINVPIGPKAPLITVLRAIVKTLKVGNGNLEAMAAKLQAKGLVTLHPVGGVLSGDAARELTDFCRSADLEWSIQDGQLQLLEVNKPLAGLALDLSPETGLIGSPTVDTKGLATAEMLMIPGVRPGIKVKFDAEGVKGGYRIISCEYSGDTSPGSPDWTIKIEAKKY